MNDETNGCLVEKAADGGVGEWCAVGETAAGVIDMYEDLEPVLAVGGD